jgi:hypothetical protein
MTSQGGGGADDVEEKKASPFINRLLRLESLENRIKVVSVMAYDYISI